MTMTIDINTCYFSRC